MRFASLFITHYDGSEQEERTREVDDCICSADRRCLRGTGVHLRLGSAARRSEWG